MNTKQNRTQIKTDEDQTQKNWNNRELIETVMISNITTKYFTFFLHYNRLTDY